MGPERPTGISQVGEPLNDGAEIDLPNGRASCVPGQQFSFCLGGWQDVQPHAGSRPHIVRAWEGLCQDEWTSLRQGLGAVIGGAQISLPPTCQGLWNSIDKNSGIILSRSLSLFKKTNIPCVNNWRLLSFGGTSSFAILSDGDSSAFSGLITTLPHSSFVLVSCLFLRLSSHLVCLPSSPSSLFSSSIAVVVKKQTSWIKIPVWPLTICMNVAS